MPSSLGASKLFEPINVGPLKLQHRVVLAPLTRLRANKQHVISDIAAEYYSQRGSTPGTLLISETTFISPEAAGAPHMPGIWSDEQIAAWKRVTDAVHAKGSFIVVQLGALGRFAVPQSLEEDGFGAVPVAPSVDSTKPFVHPLTRQEVQLHPLTKEEIAEYITMYEKAARNAMSAGFDGIELHVAHGDLLEQFLYDNYNQRTDKYGGSIENRTRFTIEALQALTRVFGQERVGIRLAPWSQFLGMRMADPVPTLTYLISELKSRFPTLMYLQMVEPHMSADNETDNAQEKDSEHDSNDFARKMWVPRPFLSAGGYSNDVAKGIKAAEEEGVLSVWGRAFIANPDLPVRLRKGIALNKYNRDTFYLHEKAEGYTDQPFAEETA
ncbi:FMN-linked oxidoreductase [Clavulina sp. PMI_390]|nr:FMN-linked oxidoreductase [Clavulina sp. PMI_390]